MAATTDPFVALANPVRRRILELLLRGPSTVNALVTEFQVRRPAISEHLQVLRNADLVRHERRGREQHYRIAPGCLADVDEWLKPFARYWRDRMRAMEETLNEEIHD